MIGLLRDIFNIADRYGLKILNIDTTDVTLMARIEILPNISIQLYQNARKDKLNMALILGNDRVYGVDGDRCTCEGDKKKMIRRLRRLHGLIAGGNRGRPQISK